MKLTEMQKNAVTSPVSDILVTAAAGSGKTQVLTGRIMNRIINENADISRMLIITFTNAAATEMRSRISKKITEAVTENPDNKHLRRQLALSGSADISTTHSFCLKVVRTYFYLLDLDPTFKLAETYDVNIMKAEALSEAMDFFYDLRDDAFLSSIELLCGAKDDKKICEMVEKIWKFALNDPFPEKWLKATREKYFALSEDFPSYENMINDTVRSLLLSAEKKLSESAELAGVTPGLERHFKAYSENLSLVSALISHASDWDSLYAGLCTKFTASPGGRCSADPLLKEKCKTLNDSAKDAVKKASEYITMSRAEAYDYTLFMHQAVSVLISVAEKAMELYNSKKAEKNVLDFDDLERLTIKILTAEDENGNIIPSDAAREIRDRYDEIYVDEYQDTSYKQEAIYQMISGESKGLPNLFMVGDMKQSIYKFRMIDPKNIFGKKASEFKDVTEKKDGDKHIKIALSKNFRSHGNILEAINSVFDVLMSEKAGEVEYKGSERLECGSTYYENALPLPAFGLTVLSSPSGTSKEEYTYLQASHVAERIKKIVESGITVYDKDINGYRPILFSDIAVLLRSPKNQATYFEEAFRKQNVPSYSDIDSAFFENNEIQILLSLMQIIDNPLQDISLVCVLRSPLFNFDENHLASLALMKKEYLYDAIKAEAYDSKAPNKKSLYFMTVLKKWRNAASHKSVGDFLSYLICETHFTSYVSAMPDSEEHLSNINILLSMAKKSDESSYKGLFNFLQYLDKMARKNEGTSGDHVSNSFNAVRIMSIHKSKGLEFPYVFLPCAESKFNMKEYSEDLLIHRDFGIGINAFTEDRRKFQLPLNKIISEKLKEEAVSEELRILYVALTRAREHIEVIGSEVLKSGEDHYIVPENPSPVTPEDVLSARNYLTWLLYAAENNPKINVNIINNPSCEEISEEEAEIKIPEPLPCPENIRDILEYKYPYIASMNTKNKYSVSELKANAYIDETFPSVYVFSGGKISPRLTTPGFLNSEKVFTNAQKGSIMHYVLQKADFSSSEDIKEQLRTMNLTEEEYNAVDFDALRCFYESDILRRMKASSGIHREEPFTFRKKLSELTSADGDDVFVLIQGIIDCYFFEDDGIVLLDYKTDRNVTEEELKEKYSVQLEIYAEALEKRYNIPVKEMLIYSFDKKKTIPLQKGI